MQIGHCYAGRLCVEEARFLKCRTSLTLMLAVMKSVGWRVAEHLQRFLFKIEIMNENANI